MLFHHFASEFLIHTPSAAPLPLFPAPRHGGAAAPRRVNKAAVELARVTDRRPPLPSFLPYELPLSLLSLSHATSSHPTY